MNNQDLSTNEISKLHGETKELIARVQTRLDWYFEDLKDLQKITKEKK